jgi:lysophospholipase L1-like esterase
MEELNRREFLMASALLTAACSSEHSAMAAPPRTTPPVTLPNGGVVLFQGDSITAADRTSATSDPNNGAALGNSFVQYISQHLLYSQAAKEPKCYNRAIGGDTVPLLRARWANDTIALQPDLLTIFIGVNDYVHYKSGNTPSTYKNDLTSLVNDTLTALPDVQLVIMEPYLLPAQLAQAPDFADVSAAAASVAKAAGATFVPIQSVFNEIVNKAPPEYWIIDGNLNNAVYVHPTLAGHAAIAQQWIKVVGL